MYLDNAATMQVLPEAISEYLRVNGESYGNSETIHSAGKRAKAEMETAKQKILLMLNGEEDYDIIFTSGATEANNMIISSIYNLYKTTNINIITSAFEHHSILKPLKQLKPNNIDIKIIYPTNNGHIIPVDFSKMIDNKTKFVSIMYANNEIGTLQDIAKLSDIAHKKGALFHTDATQAVGHVDINLKELNVDFMSFSGHKFGAPKGIGGLIYRKSLTPLPLIIGGGQQHNLRAGTVNIASICAMKTALYKWWSNIEQYRLITSHKRFYLEEKLLTIPNSFINGGGKKLPHIINIGFKGINGESLQLALDNEGIYVSTNSACSTGDKIEEKSYVLSSIGNCGEDLTNNIRISIPYNLSDDDISDIYNSINRAVCTLRSIFK